MSSTVLNIIQGAALRLGLEKPDQVFGGDSRDAQELADIAIAAAEEISKSHDWQTLRVKGEFTGDGLTASFALPNDYKRFPKKSQLWSSATDCPLLHVQDGDAWLGYNVRSFTTVAGAWHIVGDRVEITPSPSAAELISYYYISDSYAKDGTGSPKAAFTSDGDTFRLDDYLLRLGVILKWKQSKQLPHDSEMREYLERLSRETQAEGGPKILTDRSRSSLSANIAYPGMILDE